MSRPGPRLLRAALRRRVSGAGMEWLDCIASEGRHDAVCAAFPAVGRRLGRGPLAGEGAGGALRGWMVDDAGRVLLLASLGDGAGHAAQELFRLGSSAERRGVLRALDVLPEFPGALALVEEALRANEAELISAALGPFGMSSLDDEAVAQAILKCVFNGIALDRIHAPERRASPDLSRMLADYAHERVVAGRDVPPGVWPLIDRFPPGATLESIERELTSPHGDPPISAPC